MAEDVYCTLLLSDTYLPGAQVLAHSLRDGGTTKKLAVLIVNELRPETVAELQRLYDYVIPVPRVVGRSHTNLLMLNRPELNDTFTKINLWKQTQFRKIVYIDADVLVLRCPDELFQLDVPFAASPDIGWPDCFNSGVMLLQPDIGIYNGLMRLAEQGQSFDGADQGLLNEYFRNWYRLSFTYNCTPSSSYQYIPAYRHFESQVTAVHFIGADKPWTKSRLGLKTDSSWAPYEKLLGRWWAVWDRHYSPIVKSIGSAYQSTNGHHHQYSIGGGIGQQNGTQVQRGIYSSSNVPTRSFSQVYYQGQSYSPAHSTSHPSGSSYGKRHTSSDKLKESNNAMVVHQPPVQSATGNAEQHYVTRTTDTSDHPQVAQHIYNPVPSVPFNPASIDRFQPLDNSVQQPAQHYRATFTISGVTYVPLPSASERPYLGETIPVPTEQTQWNQVISDGYTPPFIAPQQSWDPLRSPPPANSAPEASRLPFLAVQNKWDAQSEASTEDKLSKITQLVKTANISDQAPVSLRPVFPWEQRAKTPTRVFSLENPGTRANQVDRMTPSPVQDERDVEGYRSASELTLDSEEELESDQEYSEPEYDQPQPQWRDYVTENQWDAIPEISNYVSALRRNNRLFKPSVGVDAQDGVILSSGYDDDEEEDRVPLPLTPNPLRRRNQRGGVNEERFPSAPGLPAPGQWDPYAKLNELRTIPTSFLARQNKGRTSPNQPRLSPKPSRATMQSSSGAQTDASSMHSSSGAQTEDFQKSEHSTQWQRNEWVEDKGTQTEIGASVA